MGVTEDINIFASIYHNRKNVPITCVVYNNVNNKGISEYSYNDKRNGNIVQYKGQNSGYNDKHMVSGRTLYLEKDKSQEYKYIGLVEEVNLIQRNPDKIADDYELKLNLNHVHNGYKSGDILYHIDDLPKGKGSYWCKRSSLRRLGMKDEGNMLYGIIQTTPLFV